MTEIASADESAVAKAQRELEAAGVRTVIGTVVNASGITLAKSVPLARLGIRRGEARAVDSRGCQ